MRRFVLCCSFLLAVASAGAQEAENPSAGEPAESARPAGLSDDTLVQQIVWSADTIPAGAKLVDGPADGVRAIELTAPAEGQTFKLVTTSPGIETLQWVVTGRVQFFDVSEVPTAPMPENAGYVQMDNFIGQTGPYFTKTVGPDPTGGFGKLSGSQDWRPLVLPFNANMSGNTDRPSKLEFSLVLPSSGTVQISDLEVHAVTPAQLQSVMQTLVAGGAGWQAKPVTIAGRTLRAGQWAGLAGGSIGALVGLIGCVVGFRRSRAEREEDRIASEERKMQAMDA